jgi:hypothetical protein
MVNLQKRIGWTSSYTNVELEFYIHLYFSTNHGLNQEAILA